MKFLPMVASALSAGFLVLGCCHEAKPPVAHLSARFGLVADTMTLGVLGAPTGAMPIQVVPAGAAAAPGTGAALPQCFSDAEITAHFGATCASHEATARASDSSEMSDDFAHPVATSTEERWYCACPIVTRAVLERCPGTNSFKFIQIAITTKEGC